MSNIITEHSYDRLESGGVTGIAVAGLVSLVALCSLLAVGKPKRSTYRNTHVFAYFTSLLLANVLQAIGTVMNFRWISRGGVTSGAFCSIQGGIKQAANVGVALWSLTLSLHLFNLLFLRGRTTRTGLWSTLVFVWATIIATVAIGPLAMRTLEKGPYFGVSGGWCWITANYPTQQIYLEYFISFIAAGFEFILYTAVLMRVRGNLVHEAGRWRFRFIPAGQGWQLGLARDLIDGSMLKVAKNMVWYPVAYTVLLVPITLSRLSNFAGNTVPLWATILTATIFNLTGFVNAMLLLYTERSFPEAGTLPAYSTPRKRFSASLTKSGGITPYTLNHSDAADRYKQEQSQWNQRGQQSRCSTITFPSPTHSASSSVSSISLIDSYYEPWTLRY